MINDARQAASDAAAQITLGADKGYDAEEFIEACQADEGHAARGAKHVRAPFGRAR